MHVLVTVTIFFFFFLNVGEYSEKKAVFAYGNVAGVDKVGGATLCIAIIQHHATSVIWKLTTVLPRAFMRACVRACVHACVRV